MSDRDGRLAKAAIVARLRTAGCVFAEDEARLLIAATDSPDELETWVSQRVDGLPLEHILGWVDFCGRRIVVDAGVFVPRQRTALLVRQAAAVLRAGDVVLDLCCGSGALGAVLLTLVEGIELHAADLDPASVRCARRNVGDRGQVYEGDLYAPLPTGLRGRVDVLVANAPYVPTAAIAFMPPEARWYEPALALDGGGDGLDVLRLVIAGAPEWLAPGGQLLFETSEDQAPVAQQTVAQHGFRPGVVEDDELGATVIIGHHAP